LDHDVTERGRVKVERGAKRIRGYLDGQVVVDSIRPLLVWEHLHYPAWYLPVEDVTPGLLTANEHVDRSPSRGPAHRFDLAVGDHVVPDAAWHHPDSPIEELADHVRFEWDALDAWFEEDEQVYVHPRDPYKRVDVLRSSRHVVVRIDGQVVADTTRPTLLFETTLPTRYYLPKPDVRLDLLTATDSTSQCPYKGTAEYYTATVDGTEHVDVAWWYRHPAHESAAIAGLVAFYDEKVDVEVDGVAQARPRTPFS
jgi:uncharacterized protein (DUF427 family)